MALLPFLASFALSGCMPPSGDLVVEARASRFFLKLEQHYPAAEFAQRRAAYLGDGNGLAASWLSSRAVMENAESNRQLVGILLRSGDRALLDARVAHQRLLLESPDASGFPAAKIPLALADNHSAAGDWHAALAILTNLSGDRDRAGVLERIRDARTALGDLPGAEEAVRGLAALRGYRSGSRAFAELVGGWMLDNGLRDAARQVYREAVSRYPGDRWAYPQFIQLLPDAATNEAYVAVAAFVAVNTPDLENLCWAAHWLQDRGFHLQALRLMEYFGNAVEPAEDRVFLRWLSIGVHEARGDWERVAREAAGLLERRERSGAPAAETAAYRLARARALLRTGRHAEYRETIAPLSADPGVRRELALLGVELAWRRAGVPAARRFALDYAHGRQGDWSGLDYPFVAGLAELFHPLAEYGLPDYFFRLLIRRDPNPEMLRSAADTFRAGGQLRLAESCYRRAYREAPYLRAVIPRLAELAAALRLDTEAARLCGQARLLYDDRDLRRLLEDRYRDLLLLVATRQAGRVFR